MDIRSILINVDLAAADSTSLSYAIDLAKLFDAELIGVAADEPNLAFVGIDGGAAAVDFYATERSEIEKRLRGAEEAFRAQIPDGIRSQWRAYLAPTTRSIIDTARIADVIVTGAKTTSTFGGMRPVDLGELVLSAGRPVIAVGNTAKQAKTDEIVIGWKDTREARRAVADAMPFLARAKTVRALTVSEGDTDTEQASLDDLLSWLKRHGVDAQGEILANKEGFIDVLESTAVVDKADLLVAGGYGHSRMREWLFGGMTRNILGANTLNRFFSN